MRNSREEKYNHPFKSDLLSPLLPRVTPEDKDSMSDMSFNFSFPENEAKASQARLILVNSEEEKESKTDDLTIYLDLFNYLTGVRKNSSNSVFKFLSVNDMHTLALTCKELLLDVVQYVHHSKNQPKFLSYISKSEASVGQDLVLLLKEKKIQLRDIERTNQNFFFIGGTTGLITLAYLFIYSLLLLEGFDVENKTLIFKISILPSLVTIFSCVNLMMNSPLQEEERKARIETRQRRGGPLITYNVLPYKKDFQEKLMISRVPFFTIIRGELPPNSPTLAILEKETKKRRP